MIMSPRQKEILECWKKSDFAERFLLIGLTCGIMGIGILYLYILEAIEKKVSS